MWIRGKEEAQVDWEERKKKRRDYKALVHPCIHQTAPAMNLIMQIDFSDPLMTLKAVFCSAQSKAVDY